MCRSTGEHGDLSSYSRDGDRLKIRCFQLHLQIASSTVNLPETLTLIYLSRINGNPLEINGSKARPDVPSFLALDRARSMEQSQSEAVYASTDRVRVGEAVRFEAYVGSEKLLKGVFRRSGGMWGLECRGEGDVRRVGVLGAEVRVMGERGMVMRESVVVSRRRKGFCLRLEEIVEEGDREGCDCCTCFEEEEEEEEEGQEEEEEEGSSWAVEMGIWVMCVGVGYLVSKASYKSLRRRRRRIIL